jgi:hypothetical protein
VIMCAVVKSVSKAPTSCLRTDLRYSSRMRTSCLSLEYIQQEISAARLYGISIFWRLTSQYL